MLNPHSRVLEGNFAACPTRHCCPEHGSVSTEPANWCSRRAPARLNSRDRRLANKEAASVSTFARNPARQGGCLAGHGSVAEDPRSELQFSMDVAMKESGWSLATGDARPAGYGMGVTAETVSALCYQGHLAEAVEALGLLVQRDCCVSTSDFYTVLKKCVVKKDLVLGRRVHAFMVATGYQSDTFLGNHILRMYVSHGRLQDAMDVFTLVAKPDAFTWSSIICAHGKHGQDKQAIQLYRRMRGSGVEPDGHVFVAALQACGKGADLESGQAVHADILSSRFQRDLFVCNCVVDMYAKCGSLEDAQRVFDGLGEKDVVSWTALIAGYSRLGMGQEALRIYKDMQEDSSSVPNSVTFVCLLQACASVGAPALENGKQLHTQIKELGHQADIFVANSLVNMYSKCGSLQDAHKVFDGLGQKDVVTWNAMISGYSQQGMGEEALHLHSVMQEDGMVVPDSVTLLCLLQACASVGSPALEKGKQIHTQIRKTGEEADVRLANGLLNMYAKCGSLEDAQRVFDGLGQKDVATWNAMIAHYSQHGMSQEALHLYSAMQKDPNCVPDSVTFVCLLQACASVGTQGLEKGRQLHLQITDQGLQGHVFVASSLVNMYAKCGSLEDARGVFDGLGDKNVVIWSAMIAGYSQQGMGQEALDLYSSMQQDDIVAPNSVTFVCLLQACASVGTLALEKGKELHIQIREHGHEADVFVANSLVNMYAKCGSLEDAHKVFDGLVEKDVVAWNAMISGYSQQGMGLEALQVYTDMQQYGVVPDSVTFVCLLQACASVGTPALEKGKELHVQIRERGHQADALLASSLVNMYGKCGSLEDAQSVFDGLGQKDVMTWTALIAGYSQWGMSQQALQLFSAMQEDEMAVANSATLVCLLQACASLGTEALDMGKHLHAQIRETGLQVDVFVASSLVNMYAKCGSLEDGRAVFDGLGEKDVVTWTALIAGYSQQGMGQEALHLYRAMQNEGIAIPNSVTFVCLLQACANVAALHLGRELHAQIEEQGISADMFVAGSLINMYTRSGSMVDARQVFEALPQRDLVTWNSLIAGYSHQGDSEEVFHLVLRMIQDGTQPDGHTFAAVLTVCNHTGLLSEGLEYFEAMSRHFGITPTVEYYTCMVDLMGRAGRLDEALALVETMPVVPDPAVWHTLLGACRKWGNVEVGRYAFEQAVKLDKQDVSAYVVMCNLYTGAQMWEQAQELQARRKRVRAWKQPGQSWWADRDGLVHSFQVGNESMPKVKQG